MSKKFRFATFVTLIFSFWIPVVGWMTHRPGSPEQVWWVFMLLVEGVLLVAVWIMSAEGDRK